ncbi:MAG: PrsW family intramembrane metalloprotease, partial [Firmicutes bacterium]|nr:PrsW family intramembrane metalloprotease [Bacillota bacterium]
MLLLILAFIVSMIPTVLLFLWIRGQKNIAENYDNNCTKAFVRGLLSVLPVIPTSLVLNIAVNQTGFKESNPVLYQALYTFLVLAFSEELMKFLMMKSVIKGSKHSWYEIAAYMTLVGLGFELIEAIPYAIGASP